MTGFAILTLLFTELSQNELEVALAHSLYK